MSYDWPNVVEEKVSKFAEDKGLKDKKKDEFIEKCYEKFNESKVPVYEPVGMLVAHSMGEPATQLILRTKHYAGAAEVSIGSGIERFEELVDARAKTKHPIMSIYIKKGMPTDNKAMNHYMSQLILRKLSDISEVKENLFEKKISIIFNKALLKELGVDATIIKDKIKLVMKIKPTEENWGLEYAFGDVTLTTIRKYLLKLSAMSVIGIEGINDAIVVEENGEKIIQTKGTNFKQVVTLDFVDCDRTYTNDIFETHKVLGVEAARILLINEIIRVYKDIKVDSRHISLLADAMCFDGLVKGVVRTGIVSTKASPLARAAFEQTEKVLFDSAFNEEEETFRGVVENVMAGLPIKAGVGKIELAMDFSAKKDE